MVTGTREDDEGSLGDHAWPAPWIARGDLVRRLDQVADAGGVGIVAAEGGTGKTVLLRQWLAGRPAGSATVTVDGALPAGVPAAVAFLRSRRPGLVVVDRAERLPHADLAALGAAAAARGDATALVVAGRADPGLGAADLELDGADLAWAAAEVRTALTRWGWKDVTAEEAAALAWATDGWCSAVRLAAAAGRGRSWDGEVLPAVRSMLPAPVADELARLSVADTFDAALAGELLAAEGDGEARLDALRRRRAFVRPAGRPGAWRLVRPVVAALRRERAHRPTDGEAALRLRVAGAGTQAGATGGDLGASVLADELLAAHAVELLVAGRLPTPSPSALAAAATSPPLGRVAAAVALLAAGDAELARVALGDGPAHLPGHEELGLVHDVLAARQAGDLAATAAYAARAARLRAREEVQALSWLQLGILELELGWYRQADEHLRLAASVADRTDALPLLAAARAARAGLAAMLGRLREGERLVLAAGDDRGLPSETRVRLALTRAHILFLRDDLDAAGAAVDDAYARAGGTRDPVVWFWLLFLQVALLEATGDDDVAFERLAEASAVLARCPQKPYHARGLDLYRLRLLERTGRYADLRAVLDHPDGGNHEMIDLVMARRALRTGEPGAAVRALHPRLRGSSRYPSAVGVWHLLTYAIAVDRLGDAEHAHEALERALGMASVEGLRRPFADDAVRLHDLLLRHRARGTAHAAFVAELLPRLEAARPTPEGRLLTPLTERELVVLGYLGTPLSAAEIGAELGVSEATVRTHLRHIYEKLAVPGRREAVSRAQELRLTAAGP